MPECVVRITKHARMDLVRLFQLAAFRKGEVEARKDMATCLAWIETLARDQSGAACPDALSGLGYGEWRQVQRSGLRVLYLPSPDTMDVVFVAEANQDFASLLLRRLLAFEG